MTIERLRNTAPLVILTLTYLLVLVPEEPPFGIEASWLKSLFMLEFLAIHSFPFMMFLLVWRPQTDKVRGLRAFLVLLLALLYAAGAHAMAGWGGVLALAPLIVGTYLGLMVKGVSKAILPELIIRGSINLIAFLTCASVFDLPTGVEEWIHHPETLWAGCTYFTFLGVLEFSGLHESLADKIRKAAGLKTTGDEEKAVFVPTTMGGFAEAGVPLLASFGLAVLPYFLFPAVGAVVGERIEAAAGWPYSVELIQYWYFFLFVAGLTLTRGWQIRRAFGPGGMKKTLVVTTVVAMLFGLAGCEVFLAAGTVEFFRKFSLDHIGWVLMVDVVLLMVLVPAVWVRVRWGPASEEAAGQGKN